MKYELVMGLEVHVELATQSKLFCSCSAKFGGGQNEHVCPACAGMPGMLPVANRRAIELGIAAGLVTNSEIAREITFDKKSYFYPDLSCGYQITQLFAPICKNGRVDVETSKGTSGIRLKQIHIEEDAGKLVHDFRTGTSLVDYNRCGVPLVEIVSMPDFRSAEEVVAYLEKLRSLLVYAGVSDCRMEEGSMRADINLSVRPIGSEKLGVRTEMKNMNSLKAIARAIEFEAQRHIDALETGSEILVQETRRWDDERGESFSMRNKEDATDYRYFPNPDIMPIVIDGAWIDGVRASLPEMPHEKLLRYTGELGLSKTDAAILVRSRSLADIFDKTAAICGRPREVANWMITELMGYLKNENIPEDEITVDYEKFAKLIGLVENRTVNRGVGKSIFIEILRNNADPEEYISAHGLGMISDTAGLEKLVRETLAENVKSVLEYQNGNAKVLSFLMGQVMKKTKGKADPQALGELLRKNLTVL